MEVIETFTTSKGELWLKGTKHFSDECDGLTEEDYKYFRPTRDGRWY